MATKLIDRSFPGLALEIDVLTERCRITTPYQEVLIGDTRAFGRALFMDGNLQSAELDEGVYHAALVHPAMFSFDEPRKVLIGGGAEGATLREVLRHPVTEVIMVDIDEAAVRACREHLPTWHAGAFDDPRVTLVFDDLRTVLESTKPQSFDVVILDLGDPVTSKTSQRAATREFYRLVDRALSPRGVVGLQAGEYEGWAIHNYCAFLSTLRSVFPTVHPYRLAVPSFCSVWGFALAASWAMPEVPDDLCERRARIPEPWLDYDPAWHRALFALCPRERQRLRSAAATFTDEAPVEVQSIAGARPERGRG